MIIRKLKHNPRFHDEVTNPPDVLQLIIFILIIQGNPYLAALTVHKLGREILLNRNQSLQLRIKGPVQNTKATVSYRFPDNISSLMKLRANLQIERLPFSGAFLMAAIRTYYLFFRIGRKTEHTLLPCSTSCSSVFQCAHPHFSCRSARRTNLLPDIKTLLLLYNFFPESSITFLHFSHFFNVLPFASSAYRLSSTIVNGPSFNSSTFISAPNSPV